MQMILHIPGLKRYLQKAEPLLQEGLSVMQTLERSAIKAIHDADRKAIYLHDVVYSGLSFNLVILYYAHDRIVLSYSRAARDPCNSIMRKLKRRGILFTPLQRNFLLN